MSLILPPPAAPQTGLYTPTLKGATSDPTATYDTQYGEWWRSGNLVRVMFTIIARNIVKSSGITDPIQISLPFPATSDGGVAQINDILGGNSTLVNNANYCNIMPGASLLTLQQKSLTSLITNLTYGLGTILGPITYQGNIVYKAAAA